MELPTRAQRAYGTGIRATLLRTFYDVGRTDVFTLGVILFRASAWLERALAQHDTGLFLVPLDVFLRSLHADPRHASLRRRTKLPAD